MAANTPSSYHLTLLDSWVNVRDLPRIFRREASCFHGTGSNPDNLSRWQRHGLDHEHELWLLASSLLCEAAAKLEERIAQDRPHRERLSKNPLKLKRERLTKPIVRERLNINRGVK